jgi:hypothetical protein
MLKITGSVVCMMSLLMLSTVVSAQMRPYTFSVDPCDESEAAG